MNDPKSEQVPDEAQTALQIMSAYLSNTNCSPQQLVELAHHSLAAARVLLASAGSLTAHVQPASPPTPPTRGKGATISLSRAQKPAKVVDQRPIPAESDPQDRATGYIRNGKQTVFDDRIICLDDDRQVTFLLRHLKKRGVILNDYLRRHNLPKDYPTTTPTYVARKKEIAAKTGFGKKMRPTRENRNRDLLGRREGNNDS